MNQHILEELGLSPNEARIYESLIEMGESSISDISVNAKIHRRNAYDVMQRLINKGLCFQTFSAGENTYSAVDPDKLTELLAEKQEHLLGILPALKKKFHGSLITEEAYIYRGLEGQKNIWRDIVRVGKDSYFIGAKGSWFDPKLESSRTTFFKEANRKKIKFIQLFEHGIKTKMPDFPNHFPGELKYRFLPEKYSTDSAINIFGDYVVTYTGVALGKTNENIVIFVIHSKNLAESYRTWFWYMWEQSSEPK
ncbi:MAG: helix-turn-helix domain-containing protein, partial [Patescibacteria group bacterium]